MVLACSRRLLPFRGGTIEEAAAEGEGKSKDKEDDAASVSSSASSVEPGQDIGDDAEGVQAGMHLLVVCCAM